MKQRKRGRQQQVKAGPKTRVSKNRKGDTKKKEIRKSDAAPTVSTVAAVRQYLREVVYELRRVVWPSRKETVASTAVIVVIVLLCGFFLGVVDFLLSRFVQLLIG